MSVSLLNRKKHTDKKVKKERPLNWRFLVGLPLWVTISFFAAQFFIVVLFWLLKLSGYPVSQLLNPTVFETVVAGLVYIFTLLISIGIPWLVFKRPTTLEVVGLGRLLTWSDLGLAPLAYIVYALILAGTITALVSLVPAFQPDQAQDVGFKTLSHQYEYTLAFATLVVIGPIAEETLFRGYLYGKLRNHVPVYVAMLATSFLFAAAHGQWNVAVDTFILSLVLCALREITGSIWAGIVVHMLKNFIAFYSLFVAPLMILGG